MSSRKFSVEDWNERHFKRVESYARRIDLIYYTAIAEAAAAAHDLIIDPQKEFSFEDYPKTQERIEGLMKKMALDMLLTISSGQEAEWALSNQKNDALVGSVFDVPIVPALPDPLATLPVNQLPERYMDHNADGLQNLKARRIDGLSLSDRIWKTTGQFKAEIELGLDVGLAQGKSAAQLSRDLRSYLDDPDKLFRRVRDKRGNLALSKAASAYNPGQGVYRSSYKNAMRLTRTEINSAYREADHERFQELDFVVGFEVRRSNNRVGCDVCEKLKGKYPKTFKFVGWHPQCRCHVVSILATREELSKMNRMILSGESTKEFTSENAVNELPANFTDWVAQNRDRLDRAKTLPYFIRDNMQAALPPLPPVPQVLTDPLLPTNLAEYEKTLGVTVDKHIFSILRTNVPLQSSDPAGAYFMPAHTTADGEVRSSLVNIPIEDRRKNSKWGAESIVYHEFGHAIDNQLNLRKLPEVPALMNKYRKEFAVKKEATYKQLDKTLRKQAEKAMDLGMHDELEHVSAAMDTIMSLNVSYGYGHSFTYFARPGSSEAEFIAHAFENYFIGNPVFKRAMPGLYADMIKMVDNWYKEFTPL